MAKAKKEKKPKEKQYKFYAFNITVQQSNGLTPRPVVYQELVYDAFSQSISANVGGERAIFFRTGWTANMNYNNRKATIFGGRITRYTLLDNKRWLNRLKKIYEDVDLPADVFPNVYETDFILIPQAHRFFVRVSSKIAPVSILKFLRYALNQVATKQQKVNVSIISASDPFTEILAATSLDLLKINISYTNDDLGKKAKKDMDKMLKKAHVGNVDSTLRPDATGTIDTNSPYIQGVLGLAKENGSAEATFHDIRGRRRKIITSEYPEKVIIKSSDPEDLHTPLFEYVMEHWRKNHARRDKNKN